MKMIKKNKSSLFQQSAELIAAKLQLVENYADREDFLNTLPKSIANTIRCIIKEINLCKQIVMTLRPSLRNPTIRERDTLLQAYHDYLRESDAEVWEMLNERSSSL